MELMTFKTSGLSVELVSFEECWRSDLTFGPGSHHAINEEEPAAQGGRFAESLR